ncbi:MAG TPA: four helix bundle protein [Thermoanaerobaculia bacterium]|nr:four helix bundle protein [Thermoanaerobaculia bacterium]
MVERFKKGSDIQERAFLFARGVIGLHREIYSKAPILRDLSRQLLRAVTSIGANLEEADAAQSRPDFVSKCTIALKEAREPKYWLRLLVAEGMGGELLFAESNELIAILTTIVRRTRENEVREDPEQEYKASFIMELLP